MAAKRSGTGTAPHETCVALLRGINVGGRNRLAMKDLVAVFGDAGCTDIRTYIQSGNVVYRAPGARAAEVAEIMATTLQNQFDLEVPVIVRTAEEMANVAKSNPFLADGADPSRLHVAFLARIPSAARTRALDPDRSPPDAFVVRRREIYLHLPNGVSKTKLTNRYLDSTLGTISTIRNWRTVLKLAQMCTRPS